MKTMAKHLYRMNHSGTGETAFTTKTAAQFVERAREQLSPPILDAASEMSELDDQ
jgi:hypothetical protein